jgi:hypothetical protein
MQMCLRQPDKSPSADGLADDGQMLQIINRKLTKNPKSDAAKALCKLALKLTQQTREEFTNRLNDWYLDHKDFYNEYEISKTNSKRIYTHRCLRSAYRSLRKYLPYLFVYQDYKELMIPNTIRQLTDFRRAFFRPEK